jgi:hypothetical protein
VWVLCHRSALGNIRGQIEYRVSIVVFADLDKVLRTGICEEIYPVTWLERSSGEVGDEVVIYDVRSVSVKVVLVCTS